MTRKNPPSFVLVDKSTGEVVYTKRATGVGTEAINKCVWAGRARAHKTGRTYFVFLDIGGLRVGQKISVPGAYAMGITEEIGPEGSAMPSGRKCCSAPDVRPSGQGMRCFNCQRWEADNYLKNPGRVRKNIFAFNNPYGSIEGADKDGARELELYIENDRDLYRQQFIPIVKNLMLKRRKGVFNPQLAAKLFLYLVEDGAKKYCREFGGTWNKMFSMPTRQLVANHFVFSFGAEADLGNYDRLIGPVSNPRPLRRGEKTIRCACGTTLSLEDGGDFDCHKCGQWYNSFGQRLKDPSQWSGARDYEDTLDNPKLTFGELSVGETFVFASQNDPRFLTSGMARGPWIKRSARTYEHVDDVGKPIASRKYGGDRISVGSVNAGVERVPKSNGVRKNIFAFNNPRQRPQNELERAAGLVGLYVTTWAPGDGLTRYRFHTKPADYSDGSAIYTANGRGEAIAFIKSYGIGRSRMNPLDQKEIEEMRDRERFYIGRSQKYSRDGQEADAAHFRGAAQESRNIRERHHAKGTDWWPNPCKTKVCRNPKHKHVLPNPLLQTIMLANPGSVKTFNEIQGVGKAKYVVNYHDGVKVHRDGSPFFDIAIFSSLAKKDQFVRKLESLGFTRGAFRNPPISAQWDKMTTRQRIAVMNAAGYEGGYVVNRTWKQLDASIKSNIEKIWFDTSSRGGTTKRRRAIPVGVNPLTRKEAGQILRDAKDEVDFGSTFQRGVTRYASAGKALARAEVAVRYGPKATHRPAQRIVGRAAKIMSNPGVSGIRFPKSGTKLTVEQAMALAHKVGDRELIRQCKEAMRLQTKANRGTKCVVWKTLPIGSPNKIDMVTAFAHYGDSPEDMYKAPKGSKKGPHMYRHKWGDGTGKTKPVPVLAAPSGKAIIKLMGPGQKVGDWMRG